VAAEPSSNRLWLLSCLVAWIALGGVLAAGLYQVGHSPVWLDETGYPGAADALASVPDGRIDPNTAAWHDLARLPRVGEALARRIVAYRDAKDQEWRTAHPRGPADRAPPVFVVPEDLLPVRGIGPRTLDLMRPHLRFGGAAATQLVP